MVAVGDRVTGYYDGDAPALLIYPPQYQALVMVKDSPNQNVKVDYFNSQLVSSDGQLQLNISPFTQILLTNGQLIFKKPSEPRSNCYLWTYHKKYPCPNHTL